MDGSPVVDATSPSEEDVNPSRRPQFNVRLSPKARSGYEEWASYYGVTASAIIEAFGLFIADHPAPAKAPQGQWVMRKAVEVHEARKKR